MKKVKQPKKLPQPKWKVVATRDIKYDTVSLADFLSWVKENVPQGTKDEDISWSIEVTETAGYYDDVMIDVDMELRVRELS